MDYAVFMVLRVILLMDYVGVKLDEARVRVSSWPCNLLVQVLFSDCFILFCLSLNILKFVMVFMVCGKDGSEFKLTQS